MNEDPFAAFGLERRFEIDEQALRQQFIQTSAKMHPDRFPDPLEQAEAVDTMSRLTDAYRVLCDPEARARAMLRLSGLEEQADKDKLPPDLLMQVMEVREEMEAAIETSNLGELERLRTWASDQKQQHLDQLAAVLAQELDAAKVKKARLELNALRYMQRMLEQMPD